jgi:hypothetical protein
MYEVYSVVTAVVTITVLLVLFKYQMFICLTNNGDAILRLSLMLTTLHKLTPVNMIIH